MAHRILCDDASCRLRSSPSALSAGRGDQGRSEAHLVRCLPKDGRARVPQIAGDSGEALQAQEEARARDGRLRRRGGDPG
eukprot:3476938-Pleurochrysis_carterae.AAC.1